jgi:hypothetical protein
VVIIGPLISSSLVPNPWMFGVAAEAGVAAKTLAAAIAAPPIIVLAVVVVNFTLTLLRLRLISVVRMDTPQGQVQGRGVRRRRVILRLGGSGG